MNPRLLVWAVVRENTLYHRLNQTPGAFSKDTASRVPPLNSSPLGYLAYSRPDADITTLTSGEGFCEYI